MATKKLWIGATQLRGPEGSSQAALLQQDYFNAPAIEMSRNPSIINAAFQVPDDFASDPHLSLLLSTQGIPNTDIIHFDEAVLTTDVFSSGFQGSLDLPVAFTDFGRKYFDISSLLVGATLTQGQVVALHFRRNEDLHAGSLSALYVTALLFEYTPILLPMIA